MYNIPIVVLFFNQPKRLQSLLTMISTIDPKTLILIQNGPHTVEDVPKVFACQEVLKSFTWKGKVITEFLPKKVDNSAFISGSMTMALRFVDGAIFLTEDVMPIPSFFDYMSFMWDTYKDDQCIYAVSGTTRLKGLENKPYFFSKYTSTVAFMTFARSFENFKLDISGEFSANKTNLLNAINHRSTYKYLCSKIRESIAEIKENHNPSNWSYSYLYYLLINNGVTIFPSTNLVSHSQNMVTQKIDCEVLGKSEIKIDEEFDILFSKAYLKRPNWLLRMFKKGKTGIEV